MRCLTLAILVFTYALISPASAQVCCPAGCVQDANRCLTTGPNPRSCNTVTCGGGSGSSSGGSGRGSAVVFPRPIQPQCGSSNPTQAMVDATTNKCVNDLTANATFWGCLFEDAAGKAEDERTGLSCPDRQAALAKQCRNRCASFASTSTRTWCVGRTPDMVWNTFFGDISGHMVGSARVERCGPPLRDSFFRRAGRLRPQRHQ
jgi:hypothetical protein